MKRTTLYLAAIAVLLAAVCMMCFVPPQITQQAYASEQVGYAYTATASGTVTKGRFVMLTAANTIAVCTATTDKVIGVCEYTATTGNMTRYAPIGSRTVVTSGAAIAVGDVLTTTTAGKAVPYVAGGLRPAAVALTAATGADSDVAVILINVPAGATIAKLDSTAVAADVLAIPVTHSVVYKTTGADAEALTLANGTPGQIITIHLVTDGGGDGTLTPATSTDFGTIVFADAGDRVTLLYVDDTEGWVVLGAAGLAAQPAITAAS